MNKKVVIGVPGTWSSRTELVTSIAKQSGGYLFAGNVLMNVATRDACEVDVYEHDETLERAFRIAGGDRLSEQALEQIAQHTFALYLVGSDLSLAGVLSMRRLAAAVLRAGGLAVKIESTGIAHEAQEWLREVESEAIGVVYPEFITYIGAQEYYYSCGMKNFGLPDASVSADVNSSVAAQTMQVFNIYQLTEAPVFETGHTFSIAAEAPKYRLSHQPYGYGADDPLDNPFGRWHMQPTAG